MRIFWPIAIALGVVTSLARRADAHDPASARNLFMKGLAALDADDWTTARQAFEASMQMNPAAPTLLNIAKCDAHDGKLTRAREDYEQARPLAEAALAGAREAEVLAYIEASVTDLDRRIARLTLHVEPVPPSIQVLRDDQPIPAGALGEALPVDPGPHVVLVNAPGYRAVRRPLELAEGQNLDLTLSLVADPPPRDAEHPPLTAQPSSPTPPPSTWGAWALVGAGVVATGAGVVFLASASSAASDIETRCGADRECDRAMVDQAWVDDVNGRKMRGTVLGAALTSVGLMGIATGTVWLVRLRSAPQTRVALDTARLELALSASPASGGAILSGRFP